MANMNCRLCLNICETEDIFNIFDDRLGVNLPEIIAKYLLIAVKRDENIPEAPKDLSHKICRMCFVHLLDFHYFYKLIEQQQQRLWQIQMPHSDEIEPKAERIFDIICLSDSEHEDDFENDYAYDFEEEETTNNTCDVHVRNEAEAGNRNGVPSNYFTVYNAIVEKTCNDTCNAQANNNDIETEDTKENLLIKMEVLPARVIANDVPIDVDKFVYDDDSEPEIITNDSVATINGENELQAESPKRLCRQRKRTYKAMEASRKSSIKETLIRLKRRKKNIYEIVNQNGHLRRRLRQENSNESETYSDTSYNNDPDYSNPNARSKVNHPGSKSDRQTVEILSKNGKLKCDVCGLNHDTFRELVRHFHKKHTDLRPYAVCCEKRHYSPKVLANHILSHSNPDLFKCEICDKVLSTQYSYRQHKTVMHSGRRKTFKCHICGKRLVCEKYFDVHVANHC